MISGFKSLLLRAKNKSANCISILRLFINSYKEVKNQKVLIVSIADFNHGRYGFQLINYFSKGGYHIAFYRSSSFLLNLSSYDRLIFQLKETSLYRSKKRFAKKENTWMHLNSDAAKPLLEKYAREIIVDLDYFHANPDNTRVFQLPYYIHPLMNQYVSAGNEVKKTNRILFYGQEDLFYDKYLIEEYFKKISRRKVYEAVQSSGIDFVSPENYKELMLKLNDPKFKTALFVINSKKVWIPADQWIHILRRFEFFIATPGVYMPLSHNIIEAMSQGTVPVLQFPELFSPPLKNQKECIVFENLSDLAEKIKMLLHIQEDQPGFFQENVLSYFNRYISPKGFFQDFETNASYEVKLYLNAEEISLKYTTCSMQENTGTTD